MSTEQMKPVETLTAEEAYQELIDLADSLSKSQRIGIEDLVEKSKRLTELEKVAGDRIKAATREIEAQLGTDDGDQALA